MVFWTTANFSWLDFVLNWVAHAKRSGIENYFVACQDDQLLVELHSRRINALRIESEVGAGDAEWNDARYVQMMKQRLGYGVGIVEAGLQSFFMDVDALLVGDPRPLLRRLPEADLLISTDQRDPQKAVRGLEPCPPPSRDNYGNGFLNAGMYLARPGAANALKAWDEAVVPGGPHDQHVLNNMLWPSMHSAAAPGQWSPYCKALNDTVTVGLLASTIFANGHVLFHQGVLDWMRLPTPLVAVHATYMGGGRDVKRHYMRERGLWLADEPERYSPAGGFLTFTIELPGGGAAEEAAPSQDVLLEQQLSQVRSAVRLSLALGRQLILPELWCKPKVTLEQHDAHHMPHRVHVPPHGLISPCPFGEVLPLDRFMEAVRAGSLPVVHEHSLLAHPLMQNKRAVLVKTAGDQTSEAGSQPASDECTSKRGCEHFVQPAQPLDTLALALKELQSVDVLEVESIAAILAPPSEEEAATLSAI